jgi:predicted permease
MKKGQPSTEILIIIGFFLLILIPLIFYAFSRKNLAEDDLATQKAEIAAQRLASSINSIGYLGGGSAIIQEIELPESFKQINVNGKDVVIKINSAIGEKQIVRSTFFNLSGDLSNITKGGRYRIEISSEGNFSKSQEIKLALVLN